ncbi:MAG TPA: class E sortase [Gaiellaceae bacterium]|jgi:sortase A
MPKLRRRLGATLIVVGTLAIAYGAAVLFWRDPLTDLYTRYQQHKLAGELEHAWPDYQTGRLGADFSGDEAARLAALRAQVAGAARDYQRRLVDGRPMGRLIISRLELKVIFVHGTNWARDLSKGPGHYEQTSVPGLGRTTAIAGHRTTFGAPFRKIDRLRRGDPIVVKLPYGTFRYSVLGHRVVNSNDWSIIRRRGFDQLVLSACHPLYSASHRWVVFARLAEVTPSTGQPYVLAAGGSAAR